MKLHNSKKLAVAAAGVLTSFAVLGTASYAWFTLSTNPEIGGMSFTLGGDETIMISTDQAQTFHYTVDISGEMNTVNTLRPVSTVDGLNWYLCDYNENTGDIIENEFFLLDWCVSENHADGTNGGSAGGDTGGTAGEGADGETAAGHTHCDNGGFYAYTDIWMKTIADQATLRLSVPNWRLNGGVNFHKETIGGSYVLSYVVDGDEEADEDGGDGAGGTGGSGSAGERTVRLLTKGPETSVRVGMMFFNPTKIEEDQDDSADADTAASQDTAERNPHVVVQETESVLQAAERHEAAVAAAAANQGAQANPSDPAAQADADLQEAPYTLGVPTDGSDNERFFIYEPNADRRSELDKQDDRYRTDIYISGLRVKQLGWDTTDGVTKSTYIASEGQYWQTYPIRTRDAKYITPGKGNPNPTGVPTAPTVKDEDGNLKTPEPIAAGPVVFPTSRLIVQKKASWNTEAINRLNADQKAERLKIGSDGITGMIDKLMINDYVTLGGFATKEDIKTGLYKQSADEAEKVLTPVEPGGTGNSDTDASGTGNTGDSDAAGGTDGFNKNYTATTFNANQPVSQDLVVLKKGEITQVRLFFWVEGQDIDCWNDIAGINFVVRLEFATDLQGQSKQEAEEP